MKLRLLLVMVALTCCERREVCPYGPVEYTPAGYPVVYPTSFRFPWMNREEAARLVDYRVSEWIVEKSDWGLGSYTDETLDTAARSIPIVIFDSDVTPLHGTGGANQFGGWIEVAIYQAEGGFNMADLAHELTHSVLGHFHP